MWGVVGKSDSKENPKSDLDLDLGFVNSDSFFLVCNYLYRYALYIDLAH